MFKILLQKPILTEDQFDRLSNIFDNAGQVVLGIAVLSPLITGLNQINWIIEVCGIIATLGTWLVSVNLAKKESNL